MQPRMLELIGQAGKEKNICDEIAHRQRRRKPKDLKWPFGPQADASLFIPDPQIALLKHSLRQMQSYQ